MKYVEITYPIETEDLILRKAVFDDWRSIYHNVWSRKETCKYMLWNVTTTDAGAQERMRKTLQFQSKIDTLFFIIEKKSRECIGFAGMVEVQPNVYEDIGLALGPEYVGKGYGKQVLNELIHMAKRKGGELFYGTCRHDNIASSALQKSCGFIYDHSEERIDERDDSIYQLDFYRLSLTDL